MRMRFREIREVKEDQEIRLSNNYQSIPAENTVSLEEAHEIIRKLFNLDDIDFQPKDKPKKTSYPDKIDIDENDNIISLSNNRN